MSCPPAWPGFAVADDIQEQLFQRQRRMIDVHDLAAMAGDDSPDFFFASLGKAAGLELRDILYGQQLFDSPQLFKLALVKNRDAVANVLDIAKLVAAHDHRLALIAQLQ